MDILIGFAVAALKAGVSEVVGSEFVQALVNQGLNIGSDKLGQYLEKSQKELSQILTDKGLKEMNIPEAHIAYVKEEIKELLQSISLEDDLFRNCHYEVNSLTEVLYKKYKEQKKDVVEYEKEIKEILFFMSQKAISLEMASDGFIKKSLVYMMKNEDAQIELLRKIFPILNELIKIKVTNSEKRVGLERKKRLPDRTKEYCNKWNENMFLNNFDPDDESAGVNIPLYKLYQLPFYRLKDQKKDLSNLKERLERCTKGKDPKNRMLLILGQPGMGKSTMITWFISQYQSNINFDKKEILVYKFTDLNIDWRFNEKNDEKKRIASVILNCLNIEKEELNGKILILDGFDEILVSSNNRTKILNSLFSEWALNIHIKDFSLFITCRENYIEDLYRLSFPYIILQPWDEEKIGHFVTNYEGLIKKEIPKEAKDRMKKMKEVFGIPIILYMTLALDISVKEESSVVEIYDQIFSFDGGIYDRCLKTDSSARWDDRHRISAIKKQIHQFSRKISIWMFENNPQQARIPKNEYEKIRDEIIKENDDVKVVKEKDVLIGNYFKMGRYYNGGDTTELTFAHRSIYEYFVAETIYTDIREAITEMTEKSQEKLAGVLGYRLKKGQIDYTIGQYLKTKVSTLIATYGEEKKNQFYIWLEGTVGKMLDVGMLYYTEKNIKSYINVIEKELNCFLNLLNLLRLFLDFSNRKYILKDVRQRKSIFYIRYLTGFKNTADIRIDLRKVYLMEADLREVSLGGADLREADLRGADLREADLRGADLREADLREIDLRGVNLRGATLRGADLRGANLREADLNGANLRGIDLKKADLKNANLDCSIWSEEDVNQYISNIKNSLFDMIYIYFEQSDKMETFNRKEFLTRYLN